jgi:hypothetical protein
VFFFHLIGLATICYGFASCSRSILELAVLGGFAIIGSAQWLRASNRY